MTAGWPAWLDAVEAAVERDRTCPDCFTVNPDGSLAFARFRGDGCRHAETPVVRAAN